MRAEYHDPDHSLVPDVSAPSVLSAPCLRDNECSQQQLVRLVGYRSPIAVNGSVERLRRAQAALQDAGPT